MAARSHIFALVLAAVALSALVAVTLIEITRNSSSSSEASELEYDWRGHEVWWKAKKKYDKSDETWKKNTWDEFNQHLRQRVKSQDKLVKQFDSYHTSDYDPNVKVRDESPFVAESYEHEPLDSEDQPVVPVRSSKTLKDLV